MKESWIGTMEIKNFAFIVNIVVTRGVVRQLNIQLAEGIPLFNLDMYLPGLIIDDANLSVQNGFIGIGVTGEYKPLSSTTTNKMNPSSKTQVKLNKKIIYLVELNLSLRGWIH